MPWFTFGNSWLLWSWQEPCWLSTIKAPPRPLVIGGFSLNAGVMSIRCAPAPSSALPAATSTKRAPPSPASNHAMRHCSRLRRGSRRISSGRPTPTPSTRMPRGHAASARALLPRRSSTSSGTPAKLHLGPIGWCGSTGSHHQRVSTPRRCQVVAKSGGFMSLLLVIAVALGVSLGLWVGVERHFAAAHAGWRWFDDETRSPLYCAAPLDSLARTGPSAIASLAAKVDASGDPPMCLPRRSDAFAPGERRKLAPPALCALRRFVQADKPLDAPNWSSLPCD